jgi:hypothetical protein
MQAIVTLAHDLWRPVLYAEPLATFGATGTDNSTPTPSFHANEKSMGAFSTND